MSGIKTVPSRSSSAMADWKQIAMASQILAEGHLCSYHAVSSCSSPRAYVGVVHLLPDWISYRLLTYHTNFLSKEHTVGSPRLHASYSHASAKRILVPIISF